MELWCCYWPDVDFLFPWCYRQNLGTAKSVWVRRHKAPFPAVGTFLDAVIGWGCKWEEAPLLWGCTMSCLGEKHMDVFNWLPLVALTHRDTYVSRKKQQGCSKSLRSLSNELCQNRVFQPHCEFQLLLFETLYPHIAFRPSQIFSPCYIFSLTVKINLSYCMLVR